MYALHVTGRRPASLCTRLLLWATACSTLIHGLVPLPVAAQQATSRTAEYNPSSIITRVSGLSDKLELTVNSSRILTLEMKIPRVQVNNPELVSVTPLSDREVQVSAKQPGVTQINLWDENDEVHTVDVLVYGDARELEHALQVQFPHSSIKVYRYSESLVLKGFVDRPDYVSQIMRLAEDYAPKVVNNISVGGVHQVLLKVKLYEVSRTKLRQLGVDWDYTGSNGGFALNSVADILSFGDGGEINTSNADTFAFGIVDGGQSFRAALDALQENQVAKILAEPNIVAVSGRPARFISGGEFVYLVPQGGAGNNTVTAQFKEFGTIVDFVPIVLGNGKIRLEVRPEVSTQDFSLGSDINDTRVPGLRKRYVDTAVEMKAGQTFALAGLIEQRVDTINTGLPYLSDIPVLGVPFRRTRDEINEVELLILVTPELVDPMDPHEVPCGLPGTETVSPSNSSLYCGGHVEVPAYCNPIRGMQACGEGDYQGGMPQGGTTRGPMDGAQAITTDEGVYLPGGTGYDYSGEEIVPLPSTEGSHGELTLPPSEVEPEPSGDQEASRGRPGSRGGRTASSGRTGRQYTSPRPYSPQRTPLYLRNASNPQNRSGKPATGELPEMIGPVGYDVQ